MNSLFLQNSLQAKHVIASEAKYVIASEAKYVIASEAKQKDDPQR